LPHILKEKDVLRVSLEN